MNVCLYLRVSSQDQSTNTQRFDLEAMCQRRGWSIQKVYEDHISGAKDSRPALDELMKEVRKGKVEAVLVWRFDRFARSLQHLLSALQTFKDNNVEFISYTEQIDTTSPAGKLLFTLLGAIAEFERSLIQERVKAGVRRARENGVRFGRKRIGFDLPKALSMLQQGYSYRQIGTELQISHVTVFQSLRRLNRC